MVGKFAAALIGAATLTSALEIRQSTDLSNPHPLDINEQITTLRPQSAVHTSGVQRRSASSPFTPQNKFTLAYLDEPSYKDATVDTFGADLIIGTTTPAVLLEDLATQIMGVQCQSSSIALRFTTSDATKQAKAAWTDPFLMVTQNPGCNSDNSHGAYSVSKPVFDDASNSVMFSSSQLTWGEAASSMEIGYGSRNVSAPASASRKRDVTKDLSFDISGQKLLTKVPGLTEICKNCTGTGKAILKKGKFKVLDAVLKSVTGAAGTVGHGAQTAAGDVGSEAGSVGSSISKGFSGIFKEKRGVPNTLVDTFSTAEMTVDLEGVGGNFLLETSFNKPYTYTIHLLGGAIGIPGFSIENILTVGPSIDPTIVATLNFAEAVTLDYGFKYQLADGAGLTIDMLDLAKSKTNKLAETKFHMLPFATDLLNMTMGANLTVALRPVLAFGVELFTFKLNPIEAIADLPKWVANLEFLSNVDSSCKKVASGGSHAVLLDASFGFDAGFDVNIALANLATFKPTTYIYTTTGLFPFTTCFPFGAKKTAATVTSGTVKATGAGATMPKMTGTGISTKAPCSTPTCTTSGMKITSIPVASRYGNSTVLSTGAYSSVAVSKSAAAVSASSSSSIAAATPYRHAQQQQQQPYGAPAPSSSAAARTGEVIVTDIISEYTTICPVTATTHGTTYVSLSTSVVSMRPTSTVKTSTVAPTTSSAAGHVPSSSVTMKVVTDTVQEYTTICPVTVTHTSGSSTFLTTHLTTSVITATPTPKVVTDTIELYTTICPVTLTHTTGSSTFVSTYLRTSVITPTPSPSTSTMKPSTSTVKPSTSTVKPSTSTVVPTTSSAAGKTPTPSTSAPRITSTPSAPPMTGGVTTETVQATTTFCPQSNSSFVPPTFGPRTTISTLTTPAAPPPPPSMTPITTAPGHGGVTTEIVNLSTTYCPSSARFTPITSISGVIIPTPSASSSAAAKLPSTSASGYTSKTTASSTGAVVSASPIVVASGAGKATVGFSFVAVAAAAAAAFFL